jgi:hypothetical protein
MDSDPWSFVSYTHVGYSVNCALRESTTYRSCQLKCNNVYILSPILFLHTEWGIYLSHVRVFLYGLNHFVDSHERGNFKSSAIFQVSLIHVFWFSSSKSTYTIADFYKVRVLLAPAMPLPWYVFFYPLKPKLV